MPDKSNLQSEKTDIDAKVAAMTAFRNTEAFAGLDRIERALINTQWSYMKHYAATLQRRIDLIKDEAPV